MIAKLSGILSEKTPSRIIIETGGVGFEILISSRTYEKLGTQGGQVSMSIHTHVREEEIKLIGFLNSNEKELFLKLLGVPGISVKIALSSMSIYSSEDLKNIIAKKEVDLIKKIPGIGKKLAERMILELKESFGDGGDDGIVLKTPEDKNIMEAVQALKTLGYNSNEINEVLKKIKAEELAEKSTEEVLKMALKEM